MIGQQHPNVPQAHPLKFRTLARGSGGPRHAVTEVIDDREELEEYAGDCTGDDDRKAIADATVDFGKAKVIAVALGQRPTPAHEVEIVGIDQISGGFVGLQTQVRYLVRQPHPATPPDALTRPGYPHHLVRVKNAGGPIVFRQVSDPQPTTLAVGEEDGGGPTTQATGEEDPGRPTTLAVGEEGGGSPTTLAVGEESGGEAPAPRESTMAVGEEHTGGPTTLALGEEDVMTTLALGEESTGPRRPPLTTLAYGEEGGVMTTFMFGEEAAPPPPGAGPGPGPGPGMMTTLAVGEESTGPTTMATGEESSGGPFGGF